MTKLAVGIDVGGTNLRAALVGADGTVVRSAKAPIGERAPAALIEQIAKLIVELGDDARQAPVGMGLAALLLVENGFVTNGPNLGWRDVPFGDMLRRRFSVPVRLVNDLDAIAFGEARCGAGRGVRDLACLFVGTGVGLGVVSQGDIVEGADGLATELGHTKITSPLTGRQCGCGERGCLEAYTSGRHLPELFAEKVASGIATRVSARGSALTADRLEAEAVAGDPAAVALWDEVGERLALAAGNVVTLWNPRVVVLGGGVLAAAPSLRHRVERGLMQVAAQSHRERLSIKATELGDDAGLVGAGLLALARGN